MEIIQELFQRLEAMTEQLILVIREASDAESFEEMDQLFADREHLLIILCNQLDHSSGTGQYEHLYSQWKHKEDELVAHVRASLETLDKKIKGNQNAQAISKQYDSYLHQTPYGAFFDKKK